MSDTFNLAEIYLKQNDKSYLWQYSPAKSLDLDEQEQEIFGSDFRIEHQIVGTKAVIYTQWADTVVSDGVFVDNGINKLRTQLKNLPNKSDVTLCFFNGTFPQWTTGGWTNKENVQSFLQYIEYVLRNLGGRINSYIVSDEINLCLYNDFMTHANNIADKKNYEQAIDNIIQAHIKAYHKIHEINLNYGTEAQVGLSVHLRMFDTTKLLTKLKESEAESLFQDDFYNALTTGELPRSADKFMFGEQRFYDYLAIKNFSLSDTVNKALNYKDFCSDDNFAKYKQIFCKMCKKYFDLEDAPVYILK